MRRKLTYTFLALITLLLTLPGTSYAASTNLGQKILPMNCVFEEVNDGLGSLYYLTPQECGVITPPQPSTPQPSQGSSVYVPAPALQPSTPTKPLIGSLNVSAVLPWQPIVAVVKGDSTVVVGSQPSGGRQTDDIRLPDIIQRLVGGISSVVHVAPSAAAVVVTACAFIVAVLALVIV